MFWLFKKDTFWKDEALKYCEKYFELLNERTYPNYNIFDSVDLEDLLDKRTESNKSMQKTTYKKEVGKLYGGTLTVKVVFGEEFEK